MKKKVAVRLPKIYSADGDLTKKWFVYYSAINPLTDKLERVRTKSNINSYSTAKERLDAAYNLQQTIKEKLINGWNPFEANDEVIYEDALRTHSIESVAGKTAKSKRNARFYLSAYLLSIKARLLPKSYESYQSKLRIFCTWLEANNLDYDVSALSNKVVLKFFDHLIETRELANGTLDKYRRHIQDFFRYLEKNKKVFTNPVHDIPRTSRRCDMAPRPIPQAYLDALNKVLILNKQLWIVTQLEYYCAIRPGEIRKLKIKDIDLIGSITRVSSMWSKNEKTETISMPRQVIAAITEIYDLSKCDPEWYLIGRTGEPGPEMVGKNTLRVRFNKIRKELKLPFEFKLYSFKHTAAVKIANTKMPIKLIQQHFRHANLNTTDMYMQRMSAYNTDVMKDEFPDM